MPQRLRLGFYMYAPAIGGAERYLRELVLALPGEEFELTVLRLSWPEFDAFLGDIGDHVRMLSAPAVEPGTRRSASQTADARYGRRAPVTGLRRILDASSAGHRAGLAARGALRLLYVERNRRRLRESLRDAQLDILHVVNGGYPGATSAQGALLAAADVGIPTRVMSVCSTALPRRFPAVLETIVDRGVDRACDAFVLPGSMPARALTDRHGMTTPAELIPWGVRPPPSSINRHQARRALSLEPEDLVVGTLANFVDGKGHAILLQAYLALRHELPSLRLVLAGNGPRRQELMARAAAAGADVAFPGNVDDPFTLCRALDVFVLASDVEGLPYVVLEAMSQGVPVVASDVGAMSDAVVHGETGTLVPPRDPGALAKALRAMLSGHDQRRRLGSAAESRFEAHFHIDRMVERHMSLYRRLAARR